MGFHMILRGLSLGFDTIRQSAETIFNSWGTIPVAYDNVRPDFDQKDEAAWARITIVDGDSFNQSLGGTCIRRTGDVVIQIFTQQWEGSSLARQYADELSTLFSNKRSGDVQYWVARSLRVGHANDLYQYNVIIPFQYDEVA